MRSVAATTSSCSACRARFALDAGGARRARTATLQSRRASRPLRRTAGDAERRARAAVVDARQRGLPHAEGSGRSARATCSRCTASTRSTRPTPQMPLDFLEQQLERREALRGAPTGDGRAGARRAALRRRPRSELEQRSIAGARSTTAKDYAGAAKAACAKLRFLAKLAEDIDAMLAALTRTVEYDGAAPDLRAGRVARAARAPARGRHRPRHDEFARRHGAQRHRRSCCPTRRAGRCCRRSCATGGRQASRSATRRRRSRPTIPQNTIVSVKRFMGRGLADVAHVERASRTASSTRPAWCRSRRAPA